MSYRPITDVWILARSKVKYFGAYPAGFMSRARDLLGCSNDDKVLHICGGKVREYPFRGVGPNDITMDLDPAMEPDFLQNAADPEAYQRIMLAEGRGSIKGILADPPYTPEYATHYHPGAEVFPDGATIVRNSIDILPIGGRVGILSLHWPRYPKKTARQVALAAVYVGNGNLGRTFAVYEKIA